MDAKTNKKVEVRMRLNQNTIDRLEKLDGETNAIKISKSILVAQFLKENVIEPGKELYIKNKNGDLERVLLAF